MKTQTYLDTGELNQMAVQYVTPHCPLCRQEFTRPETFDRGVTALYPIVCRCGWKGHARFFTKQDEAEP